MVFASTRTQTSPNGKEPEIATDRLWWHDDLLEAHFPEPEVLIDGILLAGTAANWHGPAGVGKTWAALEAARAIAGGLPWLGKFETVRKRVLVIDQESNLGKLQERLAMLNASRPLPRGSPLGSVVTSGLFVDDDPVDPLGGFAKLRGYIEQASPDVVVLDSFTRAHRSDENSAGSMADVNLRIRWLMDEFGIAVILIDHANKMGALGGAADPSTRLRGSTEKLAFVDSALFFERSKSNPGSIAVTTVKSRWMESPQPFTIELRRDDRGLSLAYGGERSDDETSSPGEILTWIHSIKHETGSEDTATVSAIAGAMGLAESTTRRHLNKLEKAGLVCRRQRPKPPGANGRPPDCYDVRSPK